MSEKFGNALDNCLGFTRRVLTQVPEFLKHLFFLLSGMPMPVSQTSIRAHLPQEHPVSAPAQACEANGSWRSGTIACDQSIASPVICCIFFKITPQSQVAASQNI
jgi:hypothetical protein